MMIEFDSTAWLAGLASLVLMLAVLRPRGRYYLFFFSIFWVYLLALVSVTVFPIPVGMDGGLRPESVWQQINHMSRLNVLNLTPLYFNNCWEMPSLCAAGIYQNILMTVPFGFGINFIARLKIRDIAWLAFGLGLSIETTQFALDLLLGRAYRSVDANDVLFNGLGVWLGYGLFLLFAWLFLTVTRRLEVKPTGLLAYLRAVTQPGTSGPARASVIKGTAP